MQKMVKVKNKFVSKEKHDLLQKYYDLDDKNGICTIVFKFDKFNDFFDTKSSKKPILKGELKDKIESLFLEVPSVYSFNFNIKINDYEGYEIRDAEEAFKDGILINLLKDKSNALSKKKISLILVLLGIVILFVMVLLNNYVLVKANEIVRDIVSEILDIAAWVFVWEAVTIYFLNRVENKYKAKRAYRRINSVSFE